MLDEAEYAEKVGHDLLMVTADLGLLAGWLAYDCMQQSLARRLYEDALLLARDSGSCELQAHVLASMAMQSTFLARTHDSKGQARESVRLADQASDAAWHEPSHRLRALVALRQAAAHAELGDTVGFRRGIGRARAELDRGPHPADVPWTEFVTPSEVTGHEAMGYVRLGQPARAAALYEDVLEDPELGPRNRICYQALRVRAILDTGDAREAIAGGLRLLPALTGGSMSTARPLTQLDVVRSAAERTGEEEFCARYDSAARALAN
jgi:hypothetical protein